MPRSKSLTANNQQRLDAALSNWRDMPITKQPRLLKTFSSGLNHQAHLISSDGKKTVLKFFSKPNSSAIAIQKFATSHQLAPDILYTNQTHDVAMMDYIDKDTISQPINSTELSLLGVTLKSLHSLPTKLVSQETGDFNLLYYYQTYLTQIGPNDSSIQTIHQQLQPIINFFLDDTTSWCVCHNDLVKENCFIIENSAKFIDWEYTQVNNPWFDVATIIYSLELDHQQATKLIKSYNPKWLDKMNTPIYYAAQCAMLWCDILWHVARGQKQDMPQLQNKLSDLKNFENNFNRII